MWREAPHPHLSLAGVGTPPHSCIRRVSSNPAGPPADPIQPDFPFSHVVADFFEVDTPYLAIADRYSNWLSVFKLPKDDSANLIKVLRQYFAR